MDNESPSTIDFEAHEKNLSAAIVSARSLDDIETWLKSQRGVKSVQLADYLLKPNSPRRDFIEEFSREDDSTIKNIVNIFDPGNQQFQFRKLRDN